MTLPSEKTFGARFQNAQTILTYLQSLPDYQPPQGSESTANFKTFLDSIAVENGVSMELEQQYRSAVKVRQDAFKDGDKSLIKVLPLLRGATQAAYGKSSQQDKAIATLINKMRSPKGLKSPAVPQNPDPNAPPSGNQNQSAISQSQLSYGSVTQYFNDLIATLTQLGGYNPSNPDLQIPSLQALALNLGTLNTNVAQQYGKLATQRKKRLALYDELAERVQRIKAYVKSQYGLQSKVYEMVKGLQV